MVQNTGLRHVGLLPNVNELFLKLDEKWRNRLKRHFTHFGMLGMTLPREHFNFEGRHPTGGPRSQDVAVYAFKAFQCRIYGVTVDVGGSQRSPDLLWIRRNGIEPIKVFCGVSQRPTAPTWDNLGIKERFMSHADKRIVAANYAGDDLIVDVQFAIHNLLEAKEMSRADLARALDISEARVSQIFSDNPKNLTLRTVANIFHAMGEEARITSHTLDALVASAGNQGKDAAKSRDFESDPERLEFILAHLREAASARDTFHPKSNDNADEFELAA